MPGQEAQTPLHTAPPPATAGSGSQSTKDRAKDTKNVAVDEARLLAMGVIESRAEPRGDEERDIDIHRVAALRRLPCLTAVG